MGARMAEPGATERGRSRSQRATLTALANLVAKLVTVGTSFATVPLTQHYLGDERFGLWMTISSLSALLAFADFGLGNGLLNAVAEASGRDDPAAIRRLVASAAAMLGTVALGLLLLLVPAIVLVDWSSTFGLTDPAAVRELRPALLVFAACFVLNIASGFIPRTQFGLQMGFHSGIASAIGSLIGLAAVLLAIRLDAGLPWLIAALMGGPLLAVVASGGWLFAGQRSALFLCRADVDPPTMARLARLGGLFFVLQIAAALAYASDNLVGARSAGAAAVGEFAVAAKLFSAVGIVVPIFLGPLWPAYGESIARGDMAWVRRTLLRATWSAGLAAGLAAVALVLLFDPITALWLYRPAVASPALLWGLASWTLLNAVGMSIAMFLNGAHVVTAQAVIATVFALACLGSKLYWVPRLGLEVLPWATTFTYLLLVLLPYGLMLPRVLRRTGPAR